jgi:hypothetical protein
LQSDGAGDWDGRGRFGFFYEPGSALFNDPADFGEGMAKGAQSLFKGTAMLVTAGI